MARVLFIYWFQNVQKLSVQNNLHGELLFVT